VSLSSKRQKTIELNCVSAKEGLPSLCGFPCATFQAKASVLTYSKRPLGQGKSGDEMGGLADK